MVHSNKSLLYMATARLTSIIMYQFPIKMTLPLLNVWFAITNHTQALKLCT